MLLYVIWAGENVPHSHTKTFWVLKGNSLFLFFPSPSGEPGQSVSSDKEWQKQVGSNTAGSWAAGLCSVDEAIL